jgi:hypothetical protein
MSQEVEINEVLKYLRETIGNQAQEIAVLKATLETKATLNS